MRSKNDGIPEHDVVLSGRSADPSRGILLVKKLNISVSTHGLWPLASTCNLLKSLIRRLLAAVVIVQCAVYLAVHGPVKIPSLCERKLL